MFYDEYTNHMLRTYFADIAPDLLDEVAKRNCAACSNVLRRMNQQDNDILRRVFSQSGRIPLKTAVRNCAETLQKKDTDVWRVVRFASKEIARDRGLL